MPRLFVALPVPAGVAAALAALLPADLPGLRRVPSERLHVTLAFVGSVPEGRVGDVTAAAEAAARCETPFVVSFDRLGRFGQGGRPSTIWVGTGAAAAPIERLGRALRDELALRRVPFDPKPLRAHVTIARVRDGAGATDLAAVGAAIARARVPERLAFTAGAVHVVESVLSRDGPRYSSRARIALEERAGHVAG